MTRGGAMRGREVQDRLAQEDEKSSRLLAATDRKGIMKEIRTEMAERVRRQFPG